MVPSLMSRSLFHVAHSHDLHPQLHAQAEATLAGRILVAEVIAAEDHQQTVADILPQDDSDLHHLHPREDSAEGAQNGMIFIGLVAHLLALVPRVAVHDLIHRDRDHLHRGDEAHRLADQVHLVVEDGARVIAAIVVTVIGVGVEPGAGAEAEVDTAGEGDKVNVFGGAQELGDGFEGLGRDEMEQPLFFLVSYFSF